MSKAARSVYVFGIYLIILGGILIGAPNLLLAMVRLPLSEEPWIRVLGIPVMGMGMTYLTAARAELTILIRSTVKVRLFVLVAFTAFVVLKIAPPVVAVFGLVDGLGALWTYLSLRQPVVEVRPA